MQTSIRDHGGRVIPTRIFEIDKCHPLAGPQAVLKTVIGWTEGPPSKGQRS